MPDLVKSLARGSRRSPVGVRVGGGALVGLLVIALAVLATRSDNRNQAVSAVTESSSSASSSTTTTTATTTTSTLLETTSTTTPTTTEPKSKSTVTTVPEAPPETAPLPATRSRGQAVDEGDRPIAGLHWELVGGSTGPDATGVTDENGMYDAPCAGLNGEQIVMFQPGSVGHRYQIVGLPPGDWEFLFGGVPTSITVHIDAGETQTYNFGE